MSKVLAIANAEEVAIKRLEQEMHSLENEKELEEIEEEMIKVWLGLGRTTGWWKGTTR